MSVAMILMAEPATMSVVPPAVGAAVFGAAAAGWLALLVGLRWREEPLGPAVGLDRCTAHPTHLLLVNAAMTVMYVAMLPSGGGGSMPDMPGMDMGRSGPSPALVAVLLALTVYLTAHAVATVLVIARSRRRSATTASCDDPGSGTSERHPRSVGTTVTALAHGTPQLVGQAGMSAAMAAMLLLTL
jgi:hypothetical protein